MAIESSSLQNCNEETTISHQGFCDSDTCLCKYSASGDLYANPKILFRKQSQKKNDADLSISQAENYLEVSKDLDLVELFEKLLCVSSSPFPIEVSFSTNSFLESNVCSSLFSGNILLSLSQRT
jgi:hypothetical protein